VFKTFLKTDKDGAEMTSVGGHPTNEVQRRRKCDHQL